MLDLFDYSYDYPGVLGFIGAAALAATILSFIYIIPESRRYLLNKFFDFLHQVFNFKQLVVEKILQFLYVFSTFAIILSGLVTMFDTDFWMGLIMMVFGPISIRIMFEFAMMIFLAVKNIIQINDKLSKILRNNNQASANQQNTQQQSTQQNTYQQNTYQQNNYQQQNTYQQQSAYQQQNTQQQNAYQQQSTYQQQSSAPLFCSECGSVLNANGSCSNPSCPNHSRF